MVGPWVLKIPGIRCTDANARPDSEIFPAFKI